MPPLEDLRPIRNEIIRDIVNTAGISTARWKSNSDPSHCYNWSFGGRPPYGNDEPTLLCIWHKDLVEEGDLICYYDDSNQVASELESSNEPGAATRAKRARHFQGRLNQAFNGRYPVRVALLEGFDGQNTHGSEVRFRKLDEESWYAHSCDEKTLSVRLVRGIPPADIDHPADEDALNEPVAPELPQMNTVTTTVYERDSEVSRKAKARANGMCEYCNEQGFQTARGGYYLETHHVIPLSCGGVDAEWNVAAICSNDHKKAHFGADREILRNTLIEFLGNEYPEMKPRLLEMAKQMDANSNSKEALETDTLS